MAKLDYVRARHLYFENCQVYINAARLLVCPDIDIDTVRFPP